MTKTYDAGQVIEAISKHGPKILESATRVQFKKGQVIFYKDHKPSGVFLVINGEIDVDKQELNLDGKSINIIGLESLAQAVPYSETCTALSDVELYFFPKSLISSLF